jgi:hypothetical protein
MALMPVADFATLSCPPLVHRLWGIEEIAIVIDKPIAGQVAEPRDAWERLIAGRDGSRGLLRRDHLRANRIGAFFWRQRGQRKHRTKRPDLQKGSAVERISPRRVQVLTAFCAHGRFLPGMEFAADSLLFSCGLQPNLDWPQSVDKDPSFSSAPGPSSIAPWEKRLDTTSPSVTILAEVSWLATLRSKDVDSDEPRKRGTFEVTAHLDGFRLNFVISNVDNSDHTFPLCGLRLS